MKDPDILQRERWLPLLYKISWRYHTSYPYIDFEDLRQSGYLGLDEGLRRYGRDSSKVLQPKLSRFISFRIIDYIKRSYIMRQPGTFSLAECRDMTRGYCHIEDVRNKNSTLFQHAWEPICNLLRPDQRAIRAEEEIEWIQKRDLLAEDICSRRRRYQTPKPVISKIIQMYVDHYKRPEIQRITGLKEDEMRVIIETLHKIVQGRLKGSKYVAKSK